MNGWISVKDKLPQETQAYGCYTDDVLCYDGHRIFIGFLARTTGGPMWYEKDGYVCVSHWMLLPSKPE